MTSIGSAAAAVVRPGRVAAHAAASAALSLAVVALVFPELLVQFRYSYIRFMDSEFLYWSVFGIVQSMLQGNLQLWNVFDQMPHAFPYLTGAITYNHVLTAAIYFLLSPFVDDQARFLFTSFTLGYQTISAITRALGFYLLARLFTERAGTALLASVLIGTFGSVQSYLGLNCGSLYNLFPFVAFFFLRFCATLALRELVLFAVAFTVAVAFDPLVGLGYFYQGLHFLLLSGLGWLLVVRRDAVRAALRGVSLAGLRGSLPMLAKGLAVIVLVIGPWTMLLLTTYGDYELAHSTSRFSSLFSVSEYFAKEHFGANPKLLPALLVDFSANQWAFQWMFLGWTFVLLAVAGAVLSRDSRKYIFLAAALFFWLLQFPRDPGSPFALAHWLNALTNPFQSVVRTAHMTGAFLLSSALFPLVVLGIDALRSLGGPGRLPKWRLAAVLAPLLLVAFAAARYVSQHAPGDRSVRGYIAAGALLAVLIVVLAALRRPGRARIGAYLLACALALGALDLAALRSYFRFVADQMHVAAHSVEGIPPPISPVLLDYQNPRTLPVREHFTIEPVGQVEPYIGTDPINNQGALFQYTNLGKYQAAPSNYKPRHKSYLALHAVPEMRDYLRRDTRIARLVPKAVRDSEMSFQQAVASGRDDVVVLSGAGPEAVPPGAAKAPARAPAAGSQGAAWREVAFALDEATRMRDQEGGLRRLGFALPASVPEALATTVFTADREQLELWLDDRKLIPAQGALHRAWQYDLQNVHSRELTVLVPAEAARAGARLRLRYRFESPLNAESVFAISSDVVGFALRAEEPGWLLLHIPFDDKWRISVDAQPVRHYRANLAFVAVPVAAGEHKVLVEYYPGSPLRWLLPLSFAASLALLVWLFVRALRGIPRSLGAAS